MVVISLLSIFDLPLHLVF